MKCVIAVLSLVCTTPVAPAQVPQVPAPSSPAAAPGPVTAIDKARAAVAANKLPEALAALQALAKADPQSAPPRVTLAAILVAAGQGPAARRELELAARADPQHPDLHLLNAQFALAEGRTTEAILSAQAALQNAQEPRWNPDQRKRFIRDGRLALAAGLERRQDYAASQQNLQAILQAEPNNGPARVRLAASLFYQGKADEAFAELRTANTDDPALAQPELQMASLHASKNETAKADEWRKKAVAARPDDYRPQLATASALLDQGQIDEAAVYIESGVKLDPSGKELLPVKGLFHRYKNQYDQAVTIFERLHRDSPNNSVYAWNLALSLAETGDKEKQRRAVELAESEARKNSRVTEAFAVLAWCYYKTGQADAAERALNTAGQLGPLSPDAGYFLAKVFADKGRFADALAALKAVLASAGAFVYRTEAKLLLADVEKRVPAPAKP